MSNCQCRQKPALNFISSHDESIGELLTKVDRKLIGGHLPYLVLRKSELWRKQRFSAIDSRHSLPTNPHHSVIRSLLKSSFPSSPLEQSPFFTDPAPRLPLSSLGPLTTCLRVGLHSPLRLLLIHLAYRGGGTWGGGGQENNHREKNMRKTTGNQTLGSSGIAAY